MRIFKDSMGREWALDITVSALKRIRTIAGIDLGDLQELLSGKPLDRLAADVVLLGDALYAALFPEIQRRGLSREDFESGLVGDALNASSIALLESLADFFPKGPGALLRAILAKAMEKMEESDRNLGQALESLASGESGN